MGELSHTARSPLGGVELEIGEVKIAEITGLSIVSIAIPNGGEADLAKAVTEAFKCKTPELGASSRSPVANTLFLGLQSDQFFGIFEPVGSDPAAEVGIRLKGAAYVTDQSDAWVILKAWGKSCRTALKRICPIDLHLTSFAQGAVARTGMEHLNVIIVRQGQHDFLVLSPRSSAKSFLYALETSARNII